MFFRRSNPPKLQTDGIYVFNFNGLNPRGDHEEFFIALVFFEPKTVVKMEEDSNIDLNKGQVQEILREDFYALINPADYYSIDSDSILMRFYGKKKENNIPNENEYEEYYGKIYPDGLILNLYLSYYNEVFKDYVRKQILQNVKFKLYS
jgi:hypothetical protein